MVVAVGTVHERFEILYKFSNYCKLQRIMAYCLRFMRNLKNPVKEKGKLTITELQRATIKIMRLIQCEDFHSKVERLSGQLLVDKMSKLI